MRKSNDGGLCHLRMSDQGAFDFRGTQPVTGDIDDIVYTTRNPVIAVRIAPRAIAGEIHTLKGLEVRVDEALMVAVDSTHLSGPAIQQHQIALARALKDAALIVDDGRLHAKERHGGGSWLQVDRARQRGNQNAAGFRLPPGVDNGTAAIADHTVIP